MNTGAGTPSDGDGDDGAGSVVKIMSLTREDFRRGMTRLQAAAAAAQGAIAPRSTGAGEERYCVPLGAGRVEITVAAMERAVFAGGLLALPRCHVRLAFVDVNDMGQTAFLARFDRIFQHAGG